MITKKIKIVDEKSLNNFYHKIRFYKSFIFYFVKFETDYNEVQDIISALNIKSRKKRIIYVYDNACQYIDNYWRGINVCGFKNNKCYCNQHNGCCRRCFHQSNNGCLTSNLTCKLYYCVEVRKRYKVLNYNDIHILKIFPYRYKPILIHNYFSSREQILKDLYWSSILLFTIKIIIRNIKIFKHFK